MTVAASVILAPLSARALQAHCPYEAAEASYAYMEGVRTAGRRDWWQIAWVNAVFGWTLIGWLFAFVWSAAPRNNLACLSG